VNVSRYENTMKVAIKEEGASLLVTQYYSLGYKLICILGLLFFFGGFPAAILSPDIVDASLTCAREAEFGMVCTARSSWLGLAPGGMRFEDVTRARATEDWLLLDTEHGTARLDSYSTSSFAANAAAINAAIQQPGAGRLVLRDPIGWGRAGPLLIWLALLLVVCLNFLFATGSVTAFDAGLGVVRSRVEGVFRPKIRELPLSDVLNIYASMSDVYLVMPTSEIQMCWFSRANSRDSKAEAMQVAEFTRAWLARNQRRQPTQFAPAAHDLVLIADPNLAYLLSYGTLPALVTRGDRSYLCMDLIGGPRWFQRSLRRDLEQLRQDQEQGYGGGSPAKSLASYLIPRCHVDVDRALAAATADRQLALAALIPKPSDTDSSPV
jgi:hypothetical protein